MGHKTDYICSDCGSKDLLIPSWRTQDGKEDFPDAHDLDGDAWCKECESIIWVDTNKEDWVYQNEEEHE